MLSPRSMLKAAAGYVRKNPDEVMRAAINAAGLRFGVPLASLRWIVAQFQGGKAPKEVEIDAAPPAIRLSAVLEAMGTPIRASATLRVDEVTVEPGSIRVGIELRDVKLSLVGESNSAVATLIKSGALDLSKPGNVVSVLPNKPSAIVGAEDNRIVIDLMKVPKLEGDARFRRVLGVVSPLVGIRSIETDGDHLYVRLRATPWRLPQALGALKDRATS